MSKVFTEISRLSEKDCFYVVERHKTEFTYPLHQHKEYELNFIDKITDSCYENMVFAKDRIIKRVNAGKEAETEDKK